jgi:hypothetical protein
VVISGTHVVTSIDNAPEVADRVLEGFLSEHPGVGHRVQDIHFDSDFGSGFFDRYAGLFVLRPVTCLMVAAAVEDDMASLTASQTLLGFAGVTLWVCLHWCSDSVVSYGYLLDLLW